MDKEVKELINEFGELAMKIDKTQNDLNKLKNRYDEVEDVLRPYIEKSTEAHKTALETEEYIVTIAQSGYESKSYKYMKAFKMALTKVNGALKKILTKFLESTKRVKWVAARLSVQPKSNEMNEVSLEGIRDRFSQIINGLIGYLSSWLTEFNKGKSSLRKLAELA